MSDIRVYSSRYVLIGALLLQAFMSLDEQSIREGWPLVGVVLVYIIHLQLRYFLFENKAFRLTSIYLDAVFLLIIAVYFKWFPLVIGIVMTLDAWKRLTNKQLGVLLILLIASLAIVFSLGVTITVLDLFILVMVGLFSAEQSRLEAENADLKVSNRALQKTAADLLEQSRNEALTTSSMREIYTLRERNRISRELHDSVGHTLSTIIIQLGAMTQISRGKNDQLAQMSSSLREFAKTGLEDVRRAIHDLKPEALTDKKFVIALEELFQQTESKTDLTINFRQNPPQWELSEQQQLVLYRAVQEALNNVLQYSEASVFRVTLLYRAEEVILTCQDNGVGGAGVAFLGGLASIKERAQELSGRFTVETAPGEGYTSRLVLPKLESKEAIIYQLHQQGEQDKGE